MSIISDTLDFISLREPSSYQNLSVFPLVSQRDTGRRYLTLDEALAQDGVSISEISESGSVPELKLQNRLQQPVLLLDGEELVGAKQNRVLNLSVLAPPMATIKIPVSCVEQGRWSYDSDEFRSSDRTHFARGRASKLQSVSHALRQSGKAHSNQSEVWNDISVKAANMNAHSSTGAMSAIYEGHQTSVNDYVERFTALPSQVGALFTINGRVVGFDLFDSNETLHKLLPKLVRSYALDALESPKGPRPIPDSLIAEGMLRATGQAATESFKAVGLGEDLRLESEHVVGGGLANEGKLIHLAAFKKRRPSRTGGPGYSQYRRASRRH